MISFIYEIVGDSSLNDSKKKEPAVDLFSKFQLPITYLDASSVYSLSDVVSKDLELMVTDPSCSSMYDHLFLPKHSFAKQTVPKWNTYYTTDASFLMDTQTIIQRMYKYEIIMNKDKIEQSDCDEFMEFWKDTKENESFMATYNFMDWDMLRHLNESSTFLQCLSTLHLCSPLLSLTVPFFFLLFPFLFLQIQGIPVSFESYLSVLKEVARDHFIGKTLLNLDSSISWDKVAYMIFTAGLYFLQIYQNVQLCQHFYENIQKMNRSLISLQRFVAYSRRSIESFLTISEGCPTYIPFWSETEKQLQTLVELELLLEPMFPFEFSLKTFSNIGEMLQCYYQLHTNKAYDSCLRYIANFEGYIDNLAGIYENIKKEAVSYAKITSSSSGRADASFVDQYYPPLKMEKPVKNTCSLKQNMIISSPNKSGKTTILKTTALNIIFTQQVGCGFYEKATLTPYTHIHSYLNIPDTSGRDSLFQAESRRCKEIIDAITQGGEKEGSRHFCIFDELYSGTNPEEASNAGYAFLKYLCNFPNVDFMLTTHYASICKRFKKDDKDKVANYKMVVNVLSDGTFNYTYKLKKGISSLKGGVRVLKDMGYPSEIIENIEERA
uniref:DNA mismatch repair proteins mutS family domain-containing protein n=1 Tax=viral metagenome TaxID=1070528 RepID=A0A6C0I2X1_9ZZZZ